MADDDADSGLGKRKKVAGGTGSQSPAKRQKSAERSVLCVFPLHRSFRPHIFAEENCVLVAKSYPILLAFLLSHNCRLTKGCEPLCCIVDLIDESSTSIWKNKFNVLQMSGKSVGDGSKGSIILFFMAPFSLLAAC